MEGGNMNCGNQQLRLIVGDQFALNVDVENIDLGFIRTVWFTSSILGIQKELTPPGEGGRWTLYLPSETTKDFPPGIALFDITVELADGNYITPISGGSILIEEKINEVVKGE